MQSIPILTYSFSSWFAKKVERNRTERTHYTSWTRSLASISHTRTHLFRIEYTCTYINTQVVTDRIEIFEWMNQWMCRIWQHRVALEFRCMQYTIPYLYIVLYRNEIMVGGRLFDRDNTYLACFRYCDQFVCICITANKCTKYGTDFIWLCALSRPFWVCSVWITK